MEACHAHSLTFCTDPTIPTKVRRIWAWEVSDQRQQPHRVCGMTCVFQRAEEWAMEWLRNAFLMGRVNMRQKEKMSQQFGAGRKVKDHSKARQHKKPCVNRGYDVSRAEWSQWAATKSAEIETKSRWGTVASVEYLTGDNEYLLLLHYDYQNSKTLGIPNDVLILYEFCQNSDCGWNVSLSLCYLWILNKPSLTQYNE